ncbi:DinB family protein [Paenibacillus sp. UNC451MF]|uniref:DinB family protein n=1 Tax=Paenibacillus sp. UNC451MF TaxID=1449063 RepID=UPI000490ACAD|nr:DinB family protein [Paenibacillus sp. UNC451MF]
MSQTVIDLAPYTRTLDQLKEAIEGLTEEQLKRKEAPGKWSVTEVLSHLADHSIVFSFRVRKVISESEVQLAAFQQDPWVSQSRANEGSASDILDVFGALLTYNSLLFKRLSAEDWQKSGVNVKGDTVTLESSFRAFIQHVQTHLGQIERIKRGL